MPLQNGDAFPECFVTRPLIITVGNASVGFIFAVVYQYVLTLIRLSKVTIPVSTDQDEWIAAEVLRGDFMKPELTRELVGNASEETNDTQNELLLFARFLSFVAQRALDGSDYVKPTTSLLFTIFKHFISTYLSDLDVFSFVNTLDADISRTVLTAFFAARATLEQQNHHDIPIPPISSLLAAVSTGDASVYALFGGQGTNEVYFNELETLYDSYKLYVSPLITAVTNEVLRPLVTTNASSNFYNYGMDVASWLSGSTPRPSTVYLASVPVSLPLIGLTQLIQYLVICRVSNLTPGQLRSRLSGATGHSQGVVSAVVISASSTYDDFETNVKKALRWLFFCGMRGQEAFPVLALEQDIVQDSVNGGEGQPTPMLSINGLELSVLKPHIDATNQYLPSQSQLSVSLYNGPRNFVVTGPPRSLFGLVTNLRKVRAPSGVDQSKVPHSQRKPAFGVRFLVVNAPYHSAYMADATDKLCDQDLKGEELWRRDELEIPVFNTEDGELSMLDERSSFNPYISGSDMRELTTSITRSLCDQIFTSPIHWDLATGFPEAATHIIDFGPGGLNGIGPLTARNLEGRGVRVIILGDKGRGEAEVFDVKNVQYEEWWSKKYAPRLVKTR